jgi:hypothetical protein
MEEYGKEVNHLLSQKMAMAENNALYDPIVPAPTVTIHFINFLNYFLL